MVGWMGWKGGRRLRAFVQASVLGVACGDDASVDGAESSDSGPSSGGPTSSGDAPADSSSSDDGVDTSTDTTGDEPDTTGEPGDPGPDVRVYYENRNAPAAPVLELVDVIDGIPTTPIDLVSFDGQKSLALIGDRWLSASVTMDAEITAYDLTVEPPEAWPIDLPSELDHAGIVDRNRDGDRWLIGGEAIDEGDLHVVELAEDGPSPLWRVDADGELDVDVGITAAFVRDGESVAFLEQAGVVGSAALWIGPAHEEAPPLALAFDGGLVNAYPDPTGGGVFVLEGSGGAYVDIRADVPAPAQPLSLLPGPTELSWHAFAADGRGLALVQSDGDDYSNVVWIPIVDGVAMDAVQVSTGETEGIAGFVGGVSPDGRWLAFVTAAPRQLYVAEIVAGVPDEPVLVLENETLVNLESWFAPDSQFLYYRGETGAGYTLRRVALDGEAPAPPQTLSPAFANIYYVQLAADGSSAFFTGVEHTGEPIQAWWVDLTGEDPAAPVRLNEELDDLESVDASAQLTPNFTHALLTIRYANITQRRQLVDLSSGDRFTLANGADIGFAQLQSLR